MIQKRKIIAQGHELLLERGRWDGKLAGALTDPAETLEPLSVVTEGTAKNRWPKLLLALDEAGLQPYATPGRLARETLMAARRNGSNLRTWRECDASPARITLEDGKVRTLRREVTHAIHNAAKAADYQMAKVWGLKQTTNGDPKKAARKTKY